LVAARTLNDQRLVTGALRTAIVGEGRALPPALSRFCHSWICACAYATGSAMTRYRSITRVAAGASGFLIFTYTHCAPSGAIRAYVGRHGAEGCTNYHTAPDSGAWHVEAGQDPRDVFATQAAAAVAAQQADAMTVGIGRVSWRRLQADRTRTGIAIDARMAVAGSTRALTTEASRRAVVAVFICGLHSCFDDRCIPSSVVCMWRRPQNFSMKQLTDRNFCAVRRCARGATC
jgi:hypothetical protein